MPRSADILDFNAPSRAAKRRRAAALEHYDPADLPAQESGWESLLRTAGLGGYAVRNALTGNFEGAGRNLVDLATSPIRALLPGSQQSWELSRHGYGDGQPNDYTEGSDLLRQYGIADLKPGVGKLAADIGVGLLTDPLTYLGVGAAATGAKAGAKALTLGVPFSKALRVAIPGSEYLVEGAGKAVSTAQKAAKAVAPEAYEGVAKTYAGAGLALRRLGGSLNVAPWLQGVLGKAESEAGLSRAAQEAAGSKLVEGITPEQGRAIFYALQDAKQTPQGVEAIAGGVGRDARLGATEDVLARAERAPVGPGQTAEEALTQIRKPGTRRNPLTGLDEDVGLGGLAGNADVKDVEQVMQYLYADRAAVRTVEQAYPSMARDPKFASGIDLTNEAYGAANKVKTYGPESLYGKPAAIPGLPPSPESVIAENAALARPPRSIVDHISEMLGAKSVIPESRSGAQLANPIDAASMLSGGTVPALAKAGAELLPAASNRWGYIDDIVDRIEGNLAKAGVAGIPRDKIAGIVEHGATQFKEWVNKGVLSRPEGRDLERETLQYLQRTFTQPESAADALLNKTSGMASASKARTLQSGEHVSDYLRANPEVKLEDDLGKVIGARGGQQARGIERAEIAKGLVAEYVPRAEAKLQAAQKTVDNFHSLTAQDRFKAAGLSDAEVSALEGRYGTLATPEGAGSLSKAANDIIADIAKTDPESAEAVMNIWRGLEPRSGILNFLAKGNKLFKRAATAGAVVPRFNFLIRNVTTGGGAQILSNPATRPLIGKYLKDLPGIILRSLDDGIERLFGGRIGHNDLADIKDALANSGGSMEKALSLVKDPLNREALAHGVTTGGFGDAELLSKQMGATGWKKKWNDILEWPSDMVAGTEQRMRLSLYKGLRQKFPQMPPEEAARNVMETMFNYRTTTGANRAARDVIPFFQFTAKAIPQTLKLLREQPSVAAAIRPLYTQDDPNNPIYPHLQDQPVVPVGNGDYLTSFGLPFEVLGNIPNPSDDLRASGEQFRRGVVGSAQPLLKTAYSYLSGRDPTFNSPWLGYDKNPAIARALGAGDNSEAARYYNALAGTGLIQPLVSTLGALGQATNPDVSGGGRALSALTGARVEHVDENRATQQLIEQYLMQRPDVAQHTSYYKKGDEGVAAINRTLGSLAREKQPHKKKRHHTRAQ